MFKKALSLLLATMLIVASFTVAIVTASAADDDSLTVVATSNFFPESTQTFTADDLAASDGLVTVTYFIKSEKQLLNADWLFTYNGEEVEVKEDDNTNVMPNAKDATINFKPTSAEYGIKGNCTSLNAYYLDTEDGKRTGFVTVALRPKATKGTTTVDLKVIDMTFTEVEPAQQSVTENETVVVADGKVLDDTLAETTTSIYAGQYDEAYVDPEPTTAPETTAAPEETTAAPTEPTTEPVAEDDTYVVAGQPADVFGTTWDGVSEANQMAKDGDVYTKTYTVDKAINDIQLKVVKNGADWIGDETGNNVTFDMTDAGTFTVTFDPATEKITVTGDNVRFNDSLDITSVYAAGNGEGYWLNGAAWDPGYAANEMTQISDGIWQITFENVPEGFDRQIKFAVGGAWTHNFGGAFVDSGVETDAAYNGDNITFDTEGTCTVKATLDVRNFDFSSKEGAKFTLDIDYDEPTDTTAPAEETTAAPTTEPAPAAKGFTVESTSNLFPKTTQTYADIDSFKDDNGDFFVTVEYKFGAPGKLLINYDIDELTWDPAVLEYTAAYNTIGSGRSARLNIMPFANEQGFSSTINDFTTKDNPIGTGRLVGNFSSVKPAAYATNEDGSDITLTKVIFKVINPDVAKTTVNLSVDTLGLDDEGAEEPAANYYVVDGKAINPDNYPMGKYDSVVGPTGDAEPPTEASTAAPEETTAAPEETTAAPEETTAAPEETTAAPEETTAAPTEPTTEPVAEDDTYVVAGQPADVFGTTWDGVSEANQMTKDGDVYTKTYTVDKAINDIQLKVVRNGADWIGDETGNNVTFDMTDAGTFTVTFDPATEKITVTGDNVRFNDSLDITSVYAAGNGEGYWLNGASWDPGYAANEMTQISDGIWQITFENVPEGFDRQIKFAVDGSWTHNFGGTFNEAGVETDAVYNGDNITFDTEGTCTVTATLDVRNFDFSTKEGAKFTIDIDYDSQEETTAPTEPTTAPVEPTTGPVEPTTAPAQDENLTVTGISNYCADVAAQTVKKGDTVTVTFKAPENVSIVDLQWGMNYDDSLLELTSVNTFAGNAMMVNTNAATYDVLGSVTDIDNPYVVNADDDFITFVFTAKGTGETEVDLRVVDMTIRENDEDKTIFVNEVDQREPEEPTTAPVEPTTAPVEPTTAPVEPTTAPVVPTAPVEPTTAPVEPTTAPVEPTTAPVEPTTAPVEPTTAPVEPTTAPVEPTTAPVEPTTAPVEPTTAPVEPTTAPAPVTVTGYAIVTPGGTQTDLTKGDDGKYTTSFENDGTSVAFKVVQKNSDGTTTDVVANDTYSTGAPGTVTVTFNSADNTVTVVNTPAEGTTAPAEGTTAPAATDASGQPSTDASSAETPVTTTAGGSTSDSTNSQVNGSTNGAVQTGNASMAIIVLLVLVSATAGIYFARKRTNK